MNVSASWFWIWGFCYFTVSFFLTATRQSAPSHSCLVLKTFCLVCPSGGPSFCSDRKKAKSAQGFSLDPGNRPKAPALGGVPTGRLSSPTVWRSVAGSTLIYYQRFPTGSARRLGCAGGLELCSRLPASGLLRPEARWPDKEIFAAAKIEPFGRMACGPGLGTALVPPAEPFGLNLRGGGALRCYNENRVLMAEVVSQLLCKGQGGEILGVPAGVPASLQAA